MSGPGFKDKVLFNVASQTLKFEPGEGRPSSDGTVTLYDPRYSRTDTTKNPILATSTATRKAVATTLTAAAGPLESNPRLVPVSPPGALAVGDYVRLTNASGQVERVRVVAKGGASVEVADDLVWSYATGATFESAEMSSPAVPTAWVQNQQNLGEDLEAVWTYTVAGASYVERTRWDLVRELVKTEVFDSDLLDGFPDLKRVVKFRSSPETFKPLVREAQRVVDVWLLARGRDPDKLRGNEIVKHLVKLQTYVQVALNGGFPPGTTQADHYVQRLAAYDSITAQIIEGTLKIPYDVNEDDIIQPSERHVTSFALTR